MSRPRLCPTCQKIYTGDTLFCPRDGARLSTEETILAGKYILGRELGRGNMGVVYEARQPAMNRRVAVKLLPEDLCRDPAMVERFEREAQAAGLLRHENIITVYDSGHDEGRVYLAMEYLEGQSLGGILAESGPLPPERALPLWRQAVAGMAEAHRQNIVHRDLKPDNLFVDRQRGHEEIKILDFGIARMLASRPAAQGTVQGALIGTLQYMAPEQLDGQAAGFPADVYALGLILCEMLTGRLPWGPRGGNLQEMAHLLRLTQPPRPLRQLRPELLVPDAWQALLDRVLSLSPAARPRDAAALLMEVDALLENAPPPWTPRTEAPAPASAPRKILPAAPLIAAGAGSLLLVALGVHLALPKNTVSPVPSPPAPALQAMDMAPAALQAASQAVMATRPGPPPPVSVPPPTQPARPKSGSQPQRRPSQRSQDLQVSFVIARPTDRTVTIICTGGGRCAQQGGTCTMRLPQTSSCSCAAEAVAYERRQLPCTGARVELKAKPF